MADAPAEIRSWADGPLPRDVELALERLARSDDVRRIAVMPDVHLSADVCVGTVVATSRTLYPAAVGGDIGCGVAAIAFDAEASVLDDERAAAAVLAGLYRAIPLVRHSRKRAKGLPPELDAESLSASHARVAEAGRGSAAARHARPRQPFRRAAGGRDEPPVADAAQRLARHRPGDPRSPPAPLHPGPQRSRTARCREHRRQGLPRRHGVGSRLRGGEPPSDGGGRLRRRRGRARDRGRSVVVRELQSQPRAARDSRRRSRSGSTARARSRPGRASRD